MGTFKLYRSFFYRKTGSRCSADIAGRMNLPIFIQWCLLLSSVLGLNGLAMAQSVALPPLPYAVPPPVSTKAPATNHSNDESESNADEPTDGDLAAVNTYQKQEQNQKKQAEKELQAKRARYGYLEFSLAVSSAQVNGGRSGYSSDPSIHVSAWTRILQRKPSQDVQGWTGFRYAPFQGTGIQDGHSGRYALGFFGPGLGLGRMEGQGKKSDNTSFERQTGWLIASGVSATNKLMASEEPTEPEASDFKSCSYCYESPGVWAEVKFFHGFHPTFATHYTLGVQLAKGKTFAYFTIGLGGWM
jgi:hypothetical protein